MRAAYVVGVGVTSTATAAELSEAVDAALSILGVDRSAIVSVATRTELAADHRVVALGLPVVGFRSEELASVRVPNPSARVAHAVSTLSVAEAAALLGADGPGGAPGVLVLPKQRSARVTVAVACVGGNLPRSVSGEELASALDVNRATVVDKVAGLDLAMATRHRMPSGVTLLGIVKHLVWVERGWFDNSIAGNEFNGCESDVSFQLEDTETVESVVADYLAE